MSDKLKLGHAQSLAGVPLPSATSSKSPTLSADQIKGAITHTAPQADPAKLAKQQQAQAKTAKVVKQSWEEWFGEVMLNFLLWLKGVKAYWFGSKQVKELAKPLPASAEKVDKQVRLSLASGQAPSASRPATAPEQALYGAALHVAQRALNGLLQQLPDLLQSYKAFQAEYARKLILLRNPSSEQKEQLRQQLLLAYLGRIPRNSGTATEAEWERYGKQLIDELIQQLPALGIVDAAATKALTAGLEQIKGAGIAQILPEQLDELLRGVMEKLKDQAQQQAGVMAVNVILKLLTNPQNLSYFLEKTFSTEGPLKGRIAQAIALAGTTRAPKIKGTAEVNFAASLQAIVPAAAEILLGGGTGAQAFLAKTGASKGLQQPANQEKVNQGINAALAMVSLRPEEEQFFKELAEELFLGVARQHRNLTIEQKNSLRQQIVQFFKDEIVQGGAQAKLKAVRLGIAAAMKLVSEETFNRAGQLVVDLVSHKDVVRHLVYQVMQGLIHDKEFVAALKRTLQEAATGTAKPLESVWQGERRPTGQERIEALQKLLPEYRRFQEQMAVRQAQLEGMEARLAQHKTGSPEAKNWEIEIAKHKQAMEKVHQTFVSSLMAQVTPLLEELRAEIYRLDLKGKSPKIEAMGLGLVRDLLQSGDPNIERIEAILADYMTLVKTYQPRPLIG